MKKKSFMQSLFTVGIGSLLNLIIGFFSTPIITRVAEPATYGQLSVFNMYTSIAVMVLCMGMDQSLIRFYYKKDNVQYKKKLFGECLLIPLFTTVFILVVEIVLMHFNVLKFEFNHSLTILLALNIWLSVCLRFFSILARVNYNDIIFSGGQVLQKSVYVVLALFLLLCVRMQSIFALCLATVSATLCALLLYVITQHSYIPNRQDVISKKDNNLKELMLFGYPYIFSMGITTLFQSLDKIALNKYKSYEDVGIYTSAMTLVALFAIVQSSFNTIWAPKSVEHYEKNPDDKKFYKKVFNIVTVTMFFIGILLILFKDIFAFLLGEKYREAAYIMPFLIFHPIMYTVSETTAIGITFSKKVKLNLVVAGGACLINYIGNTILVPVLGCKGAAISTGISYIVFFAIRTLCSEKNYKVSFDLRKFSVITILLIANAFYNTFWKFSYIAVIISLVCFGMLTLLYFDTIKWIIQYAFQILNKHRKESKHA